MSKNKYASAVFGKMKEKIENDDKQSYNKDIIHFESGNSYVVRIIPNIEKPENTIVKTVLHGWNSLLTGGYISFKCKKGNDKDALCPACNERRKLYREKEDAMAKNMSQQVKYLMNVYVVSDPTTPENEGEVKILRCGNQVYKVIKEAIEGEDSKFIGERMLDFSEEGCNLRIKVEKNSGGYNNYEMTRFLPPEKIAVTAEELQDKLHELDYGTDISNSEIERLIDRHLYCNDDSEGGSSEKKEDSVTSENTEEEVVNIDDGILDEFDEF